MVDVKNLLEYNEEVRHRYFDALTKLPWDELVKNREASFHSLRNIFIHTLGAIDYWLDFLLKEQLHSHREFDEYNSIEDVRRYMQQVEARLHRYLDSFSSKELLKKYTRTNDAGENIEITAEDVLIHVFEEEVHHRGEIIGLLWQIGVEPPLMGWKNL
ncbi:DinB family protein [Candidatus Bathyarchaeota archaeon]|nr:DinB family protein [Candidatus Bathyarchaeota archaeon]